MNASVAIQILPQQVDREKMLECVDAVIQYIASCGVQYSVGAFETVLEGDFEVLMEIVRACFRICVAAGAPGALGFVKVNYCPDGVITIEEKTEKYQK
ncbi:MAG: thiamine-binding protein [Pyramidobacter sp.]|nr:thiamine-binding protein [Pyramidobacter sp.]